MFSHSPLHSPPSPEVPGAEMAPMGEGCTHEWGFSSLTQIWRCQVCRVGSGTTWAEVFFTHLGSEVSRGAGQVWLTCWREGCSLIPHLVRRFQGPKWHQRVSSSYLGGGFPHSPKTGGPRCARSVRAQAEVSFTHPSPEVPWAQGRSYLLENFYFNIFVARFSVVLII